MKAAVVFGDVGFKQAHCWAVTEMKGEEARYLAVGAGSVRVGAVGQEYRGARCVQRLPCMAAPSASMSIAWRSNVIFDHTSFGSTPTSRRRVSSDRLPCSTASCAGVIESTPRSTMLTIQARGPADAWVLLLALCSRPPEAAHRIVRILSADLVAAPYGYRRDPLIVGADGDGLAAWLCRRKVVGFAPCP